MRSFIHHRGHFLNVLPVLLAVACFCAAGCRTFYPASCRPLVASELADRSGQPVDVAAPGDSAVPPDVILEDGITEQEAVALALWNNSQYAALMSELGISRAQLYDAGLLADPELVILFPVGPKQLEFTAYHTVDAMWLRPIRVRAAERDMNALAQQMIDNGLNLIRDVRAAHAEMVFAQDRLRLAEDMQNVRSEIAELGQKRLQAGDISQLEAASAQIESLRATADYARWQQDVLVAEARLRELTGLAGIESELKAVANDQPITELPPAEELLDEALAMRPDLRAAEINIESAEARMALAQNRFMRLDVGADANSDGVKGFEAGPAVRFTLPLFNANQGQVAIAEAQLEQAERRWAAIRDRVVQQVTSSRAQLQQSSRQLEIIRDEMMPALETAVDLARNSYREGGAPYFLVLETISQFFDARARQLEAEAAQRRARAELERAVGHRVVPNKE